AEERHRRFLIGVDRLLAQLRLPRELIDLAAAGVDGLRVALQRAELQRRGLGGGGRGGETCGDESARGGVRSRHGRSPPRKKSASSTRRAATNAAKPAASKPSSACSIGRAANGKMQSDIRFTMNDSGAIGRIAPEATRSAIWRRSVPKT